MGLGACSLFPLGKTPPWWVCDLQRAALFFLPPERSEDGTCRRNREVGWSDWNCSVERVTREGALFSAPREVERVERSSSEGAAAASSLVARSAACVFYAAPSGRNIRRVENSNRSSRGRAYARARD